MRPVVKFDRSNDIYVDGVHYGYFDYSRDRIYLNSYETIGGKRISTYYGKTWANVYTRRGNRYRTPLPPLDGKNQVKHYIRLMHQSPDLRPVKYIMTTARDSNKAFNSDMFRMVQTADTYEPSEKLAKWIAMTGIDPLPSFGGAGGHNGWYLYFATEEDMVQFKLRWL